MAGRAFAARTLLALLLAVAGMFGLLVAPALQARGAEPLLTPYLTPGPLPATLLLGALTTAAVALGAQRTALVLAAATVGGAALLVREWGLIVLAAAVGSALALLVAALLVPRLD